ncbi:hypothetical protein RJT34_29076 [Clitoria ternatea]|uniref:Uncharacterized protein n=1 Tax=Clitoria ternatea TaxID=43366 RepID=A0AAN9FC39_CLITE
MSLPTSTPDITRPCVEFGPTIWGDLFLQYDSASFEVNDSVRQQVQIQKEEVRRIFLSSTDSISQKLNFIDSLQRLGVSYHFEREIDEALEKIFIAFTNNNITTNEDSLRYHALLFRLLRKKGYQISPDIFIKFKDSKGNFNEEIGKDVEGMWNLYEAAQLRMKGEDILDEALDFTYTHLNSLTNRLSPSLAAQITHCLRKPFHKAVPRLEARSYISFYEEDPSHSILLLNFAKLDYNLVQKLHQKEVGTTTKWWKESNFATKVSYARDRVVECYFWALAMSYEPEYSIERMVVAKLIACISLLDDTYDAYGTIEELELFTLAIQRWDISVIESLPDCMKVVYNAIVKFCDEIELVIAKDGKSSMVQSVKQAFHDLAQAYLVEAKWCHEGYIPSYDEYKANGIITSVCPLYISSFLLFGKFSTQYIIDWIFSIPKFIEAISLISRLVDDTSSHKFEQQRVHVASAVECCMKQYKISQDEAYKLILNDINDFWKVTNEECLKSTLIPKPALDIMLNVARLSEFIYDNFEDKYTNAELMKDYIAALLVDPICIEQHDEE